MGRCGSEKRGCAKCEFSDFQRRPCDCGQLIDGQSVRVTWATRVGLELVEYMRDACWSVDLLSGRSSRSVVFGLRKCEVLLEYQLYLLEEFWLFEQLFPLACSCIWP